MRHIPRLAAPLIVLAAACASPSDAEPPATATLAAGAAEGCTLETPLEPGIPGSPGHLIPSPRNPNGLSELAELMRVMEADTRAARDAILAGRVPGPTPEAHYRMRCAWPTKDGARNARYDGLSVHYLVRLEELHAAEADHAARYEALIDACATCHQSECPGPLAAIEELRLPTR